MNIYSIDEIDKELTAALDVAALGLAPKVFFTKMCVDKSGKYICGYIVMEKIKGKIITSIDELRERMHDIYHIYKTLIEHGIYYTDFNISNFMIDDHTGQMFIIDFGNIEKSGQEFTEEEIFEKLSESITVRLEYGL